VNNGIEKGTEKTLRYSDPSMDRRIKTIGELEQVFEPCHMILKGLKGGGGGGKKHLPPQCFCQEKKNTKRRSIIRGFSLFVGGFGT